MSNLTIEINKNKSGKDNFLDMVLQDLSDYGIEKTKIVVGTPATIPSVDVPNKNTVTEVNTELVPNTRIKLGHEDGLFDEITVDYNRVSLNKQYNLNKTTTPSIEDIDNSKVIDHLKVVFPLVESEVNVSIDTSLKKVTVSPITNSLIYIDTLVFNYNVPNTNVTTNISLTWDKY